MAISKERLALLRKLESIVGESCYNASIQNWGPNAEFLGEGRSFRYPITFTSGDENRKGAHWFDELSENEQMSGRYKFGANELLIMRALDEVLSYLERNHSLEH